MSNIIGIVPAAGAATRFAGVYKELLPDKFGIPLIRRTVNILRHVCDQVVVVTNKDKIHTHAQVLGTDCIYTLQDNKRDIWGAMLEGMKIEADHYWFMMPDTIVELDLEDLEAPVDTCIYVGTFVTNTPGRFGCFHEGMVIDKDECVSTPARAWGMLGWDKIVKDYWKQELPMDYTDAINLAMCELEMKTIKLTSYIDIAGIEDYMRYINNYYCEEINK